MCVGQLRRNKIFCAEPRDETHTTFASASFLQLKMASVDDALDVGEMCDGGIVVSTTLAIIFARHDSADHIDNDVLLFYSFATFHHDRSTTSRISVARDAWRPCGGRDDGSLHS